MGASLHGNQGLELRMLWGDVRLEERFLAPAQAKRFTVGSSAGCDFAMAGRSFEAITACDGGYAVRFTERMKGEITRGTETIELAQVIESGEAESDGEIYSLPVGPKDHVWVDLGGIVMEAFPQRAPSRVKTLGPALDYTTLNIALAVFFAFGLFVVATWNRDLMAGEQFDDDWVARDPHIVHLVEVPPRSRRGLPGNGRGPGQPAPRHDGPEGKAGRTNAPEVDRRLATSGNPSEREQAHALTDRIFGGRGAGISTLLGSPGIGGSLAAAIGHLTGRTPGDAAGVGGLGLRGTEGGGGGANQTVGIGAIGTLGRAGGHFDYGYGIGVMGGKKSIDLVATTSDGGVVGSLDRELIRGVIRQHREQIRYCYESELARAPNLAGKVSVKFLISAHGSVASSLVDQSTTGNATLESCVARKVSSWVFPKPKGGGVVVVTYPFVFARAGE